jgi:hypothetical protein
MLEDSSGGGWGLAAPRTYVREKAVRGVNRDALKAVEEWRAPLKPTNERERQRKQRGPLLEAIQEVQDCALNLNRRRKAPQEPEEDLLNDTVTKNWMPWLYEAMVAPDADPDVKRMTLEAGDKANINQIYAGGASKHATRSRAPNGPPKTRHRAGYRTAITARQLNF